MSKVRKKSRQSWEGGVMNHYIIVEPTELRVSDMSSTSSDIFCVRRKTGKIPGKKEVIGNSGCLKISVYYCCSVY